MTLLRYAPFRRTKALAMLTSAEILSKVAELMPEWLVDYQAGETFPREAFFASRIIYYPGSGTDGHPFCVFGKSLSGHCFVYADNGFSKGDLERQLVDPRNPEHPLCYRLVSLVDVAEVELTPRGWKRHAKLPPDVKFHDDPSA